MSNKIYTTLLKRQIDLFVATFQNDSTSLFRNEQNALIHPGEYGMYRERCFCALLKSVLSRDCSLSDGFIFSSRNDRITSQCDILVKDSNSMPLTDSGIGKFHPVEDIYAIIEMKSTLSKTTLKAALRKLATAKKIGDDRTTLRHFPMTSDEIIEQIPTFLVCNKLDFDGIDSLDFEDIYHEIDRKYWHNAILSVEDGLICYQYSPSHLSSSLAEETGCRLPSVSDNMIIGQCPQFSARNKHNVVYNCAHAFLPANREDKYQHIIRFLTLLRQSIALSVKYQFDSAQYINNQILE